MKKVLVVGMVGLGLLTGCGTDTVKEEVETVDKEVETVDEVEVANKPEEVIEAEPEVVEEAPEEVVKEEDPTATPPEHIGAMENTMTQDLYNIDPNAITVDGISFDKAKKTWYINLHLHVVDDLYFHKEEVRPYWEQLVANAEGFSNWIMNDLGEGYTLVFRNNEDYSMIMLVVESGVEVTYNEIDAL